MATEETVTIDTTSVPPETRYLEADWRPVRSGSFETMSRRLIPGRFLTDADTDQAHGRDVGTPSRTISL